MTGEELNRSGSEVGHIIKDIKQLRQRLNDIKNGESPSRKKRSTPLKPKLNTGIKSKRASSSFVPPKILTPNNNNNNRITHENGNDNANQIGKVKEGIVKEGKGKGKGKVKMIEPSRSDLLRRIRVLEHEIKVSGKEKKEFEGIAEEMRELVVHQEGRIKEYEEKNYELSERSKTLDQFQGKLESMKLLFEKEKEKNEQIFRQMEAAEKRETLVRFDANETMTKSLEEKDAEIMILTEEIKLQEQEIRHLREIGKNQEGEISRLLGENLKIQEGRNYMTKLDSLTKETLQEEAEKNRLQLHESRLKLDSERKDTNDREIVLKDEMNRLERALHASKIDNQRLCDELESKNVTLDISRNQIQRLEQDLIASVSLGAPLKNNQSSPSHFPVTRREMEKGVEAEMEKLLEIERLHMAELKERDDLVESLKIKLRKKRTDFQDLKCQYDACLEACKGKNLEFGEKQARLLTLEHEKNLRNKELDHANDMLSNMNEELSIKEEEILFLEKEIVSLKSQVSLASKENEGLRLKLEASENALSRRQEELEFLNVQKSESEIVKENVSQLTKTLKSQLESLMSMKAIPKVSEILLDISRS